MKPYDPEALKNVPYVGTSSERLWKLSDGPERMAFLDKWLADNQDKYDSLFPLMNDAANALRKQFDATTP